MHESQQSNVHDKAFQLSMFDGFLSMLLADTKHGKRPSKCDEELVIDRFASNGRRAI